jgi:stage III sporulation protein AD
MPILKICITAIIGAIAVMIIREHNKEYALYISIACGVVILYFSFGYVGEIVQAVKSISDNYGIREDIIEPVFKITATAYIAKFSSDILKDANLASTSEKIEIFAKLYILFLTLPILNELLNFILELLG